MLSGIRLYTTDNTWRGILSDLGACVVGESKAADLALDSIALPLPVAPLELKSHILKAIDAHRSKIIGKIFGRPVALSGLQMRLVVLLHQAGCVTADEIKNALGYSPDAATHAIDTAIYNLRKSYGRDFIQLKEGKYCIGKL